MICLLYLGFRGQDDVSTKLIWNILQPVAARELEKYVCCICSLLSKDKIKKIIYHKWTTAL